MVRVGLRDRQQHLPIQQQDRLPVALTDRHLWGLGRRLVGGDVSQGLGQTQIRQIRPILRGLVAKSVDLKQNAVVEQDEG